MALSCIISGTDTGVGKTFVAAMLLLGLEAAYWKPIQSGTEGGTDTQRVQVLTGGTKDRFLPEAYVFSQPLSPHRAAELDGVEIDVERLVPPLHQRPLVIEGAGGLLVPVTRHVLQIDLFKRWGAPVILCARTGLGTINHTLLSIEALQRRGMNLLGLVFIGEDNPDTLRSIAEISGARILGHVPFIDVPTPDTMCRLFTERVRGEDFKPRPSTHI